MSPQYANNRKKTNESALSDLLENKDAPKALGTHLKELKRRIFLSIMFFVTAAILAFNYSKQMYMFIAHPLAQQSAALMGPRPQSAEITMIYTAMGEGFMVYLKLSLYAAIFASIPFWLFQLYKFIAPGLLKAEKRIVIPCFMLSPALFYLGAIFLYYVALPLLWKFFLGFQNLDSHQLNIVLYAKLSEYLSLILSLALAFGLSFQLPVVVLVLTSIGLIGPKQLRGKRKYAVVLIFILAAIATPPDVVSQVCLAIPLLILYELSILLSKAFVK